MKRVVIYLFSSNLSHITGKQEAVLGFVGKTACRFPYKYGTKIPRQPLFHLLLTF